MRCPSRPEVDILRYGKEWQFPVLLALALLWSAPAWAAEPGGWTTKELFDLLAGQQSARARFVEHRFLTIVIEPLVSSGTVAFERPGRVEKQTLKPARERLSLAGGTLTVEQEGRSRHSFDVSGDPALWALIEAFRATLDGDLASLEQHYGLGLDGAVDKWRLRLTPRNAEIRTRVEVIKIEGVRAHITSIEIRETGGDRTVMSLLPESS